MLDLIIVFICVIALIIGSYTDFKVREVPDWLSYGLIFAGLGARLIYSLVEWEWQPIVFGIAGFLLFMAVAYLMFYTGQWGGGDSKLLMGLGAMIGFDFTSFGSGIPFMITFTINILIVGALYGFGWSIYLAIKHWKKFKVKFWYYMHHPQVKKTRLMVIIVSVLLILSTLLIKDFLTRLLFVTLIVLIYMTLYLWVFAKAVEKSCMFRFVEPQKLTEGDWIAKNIKIDGKYICGPKDLGIEKKQIQELISLKRRGKIKKVLIKEGIPFVPSFLIAYLLTTFFGSIFF